MLGLKASKTRFLLRDSVAYLRAFVMSSNATLDGVHGTAKVCKPSSIGPCAPAAQTLTP